MSICHAPSVDMARSMSVKQFGTSPPSVFLLTSLRRQARGLSLASMLPAPLCGGRRRLSGKALKAYYGD
jgi:hypothetical protein